MEQKTGKRNERLATLGLVVVTILWGGGFVFTKMSLNAGLSASAVLFGRFALATVLLGIVFGRQIKRHYQKGQWKGGLVIGLILFSAFYIQTLGLESSTPSYSAFLTATYVVMVPILWWIVTKKRPQAVMFVSCGLSLAGAGVLSLNFDGGAAIGLGDALTLISAVLFAAQIVATGILGKTMHYTVLVFFQFAVATVLSFGAFLITDRDFSGFVHPEGILSLLYLGILSTGVCYVLQTMAQRHLSSAKAGIIMACEAVFGTVFSVLLGYDQLTTKMVVGGLVMFAAVLLPEVWLARKTTVEEPMLKD